MNTPTTEDYSVAAEKLATAMRALDELSNYWDKRELPADFLDGITYPFGLEFDEQIAEIGAAVEALFDLSAGDE